MFLLELLEVLLCVLCVEDVVCVQLEERDEVLHDLAVLLLVVVLSVGL